MIYAQEILTSKEMQEDIEFLTQTIKDVNPHITIREKVTGTHIYEEIDSLRKNAKLEDFENFYYLAKKILLLSQDQHNDFQESYFAEPEDSNLDISEESIAISQRCSFEYDNFHPSGSISSLEYLEGNYYFTRDWYDRNGRHLIPVGARLLRVNNLPIDEYVSTVSRIVDNSIRWDSDLKKYYSLRVYVPQLIGYSDSCLLVFSKDAIKDSLHYRGATIKSGVSSDYLKPKVLYFNQDHILYVRVPSMETDHIDFYTENILKYKDKQIDKVIIDVRSNQGGNDLVWMNIVSAITGNINFVKEEDLYIRNTSTAINYLQIVRKMGVNKEDVFSIRDDSFIRVATQPDTIKNWPPSINYSGKIYVMVDNRCFSSTLAFIATCNRNNDFITIGQSSGYIGGRGITPFFFVLPHSKLLFTINPILDTTGIENVENYYDNYVKIPVTCSIQDITFETDYKGERYGEEFLYKYDPVFQKVLKLE
ncbi:MAG: hypothetical protein LBI82_03925 [Dysgonamonadaceae bacterium]|jgi:hypothetical protein|nr:hypothetical protein [Dysgonamonadaceae bacterium]